MGIRNTRNYVYETNSRWTGNRSGAMSTSTKREIAVSSPAEFKGDPAKWSPEELLVGAVDTCTMATFLALAEKHQLPIVSYQSEAEGLMEWSEGSFRFTRVVVRPTVVIGTGQSTDHALEIFAKTKPHCFISNSVSAEVQLEPVVEQADSAEGHAAELRKQMTGA